MSDKPFNAFFSLLVPLKKVLLMLVTFNMGSASLSDIDFAFDHWRSQCKDNNNSSKKLQVIRRHAHIEDDSDHHTVNDGAEDDGSKRSREAVDAKNDFADDDGDEDFLS